MEIFIHLEDTSFSDIVEKVSEKQGYIVWNIYNKKTFFDLIEKDVCKNKYGRMFIVDKKDVELIKSKTIPYHYSFLILSDIEDEDSMLYSEFNENTFKIFISAQKQISDISNNNKNYHKFLINNYLELKKDLVPVLSDIYNDILIQFKKYNHICLFGEKQTGKTYFAKTLAEDNIYDIVDGKDDNIERILFGEGLSITGLFDNGNIIIIENSDSLPLRVLKKLTSFLVYGVFTRKNSTLNIRSFSKIIFIVKGKEIDIIENMMPLYRYIKIKYTLPNVDNYTKKQKIDTIKLLAHKNLSIDEQSIYTLDKYFYKDNLGEMKDIANFLSRVNGTITYNKLPYWLIEKKSESNIANSYLRRIVEDDIYNLDKVEELVIKGALIKCSGIKRRTCEILGVYKNTLNKKMEKYNIILDKFMEENV